MIPLSEGTQVFLQCVVIVCIAFVLFEIVRK